MPPAKGPQAQTIGSAEFDPDAFLASWAQDFPTLLPQGNDLRSSIIAAFNLAQSDNYVYHAVASVTLAQVQEAIQHGDENGLHAWYPDEAGKSSEVGPLPDIWTPCLILCARLSCHHSILRPLQLTLLPTPQSSPQRPRPPSR